MRAPFRPHVAGQQRRGGDRAARLGDELEAVEQERHRGEDLVVAAEHDVVDELAHDLERPLARLGQHLAVGDVARDRDLDPLAGLERALDDARRLDADHARARVQRLDHGGAPGHQAAAADRGEQQVELAGVLEQLERGGARAGGDPRVVVGGHERHLAPLGELAARLHLRHRVAVVGLDLRAVAVDRRELRGRRVLGHEDRGADAQLARRQRHRLGVVAGADRAHAARPLLLIQRREEVVGAAELERAAALEALALEEDAGAERPRGHHRRAVRDAVEDARRRADVVEVHVAKRASSARISGRPIMSVKASNDGTSCSPSRSSTSATARAAANSVVTG